VTSTRTVWFVLAALCLTGIAVTTLGSSASVMLASPWCVVCGSIATADAIANVALFVPAAFSLTAATGAPRRVLLMLAVSSVAIEVAQAWVFVGRNPSVADVLSNSSGALIGAMLGSNRWMLLRPTRARAPTLASMTTIVWLAVLAATSVLLRPSAPRMPYWGQRGGAPDDPESFRGTVTDVSINRRPLPFGPVDNVDPFLDALREAHVRIELGVIMPADRPYARVAIARMSNPTTELFRFDQRGADIEFGLRTRSADVRLRSPKIRLSMGAAVPGNERADSRPTLRLSAGRDGSTLVIERLDIPGRRSTLDLPNTMGWALLLPQSLGQRLSVRTMTVLWIAAFLIPIGYWSATSRATTWSAQAGKVTLPLVALVGGFFALPRLMAAPMPDLGSWIAGSVAIMAGALARRHLDEPDDTPTASDTTATRLTTT
jgi:hypothetical protein